MYRLFHTDVLLGRRVLAVDDIGEEIRRVIERVAFVTCDMGNSNTFSLDRPVNSVTKAL